MTLKQAYSKFCVYFIHYKKVFHRLDNKHQRYTTMHWNNTLINKRFLQSFHLILFAYDSRNQSNIIILEINRNITRLPSFTNLISIFHCLYIREWYYEKESDYDKHREMLVLYSPNDFYNAWWYYFVLVWVYSERIERKGPFGLTVPYRMCVLQNNMSRTDLFPTFYSQDIHRWETKDKGYTQTNSPFMRCAFYEQKR